MKGNATLPAPDPDELEVSVFGPGVGECIVVHLGNAEWMVVDSCVDKESKQPVALTYLKELGVDVERQVCAVVVTHWHDDHMRGAARVLEAAKNAKFFCSGALDDSDFYEFVVAAKEHTQTGEYESEFLSILHLLERRATPGTRPASIGPEWSFANQCIYRGALSSVYSLSPSSGTLSLSFQQRAAMSWTKPTRRGPIRRPIALEPNEISLVLWIEFPGCNVLLGGDLEDNPSPTLGWQAIVLSTARPPGRALIYKVAHHGSPNADCPQIWTDLLWENPVAVVTPFLSGPRPRPQKEDKRRIRRFTNRAYCTSSRTGWQPKRLHPTERRVARMRRRQLRSIEGPMGQVRIRFKVRQLLASLGIDHFRGAQPL